MPTERDALIAAILANPDDDAPRKVFADWCDEHGMEDMARLFRRGRTYYLLIEHLIFVEGDQALYRALVSGGNHTIVSRCHFTWAGGFKGTMLPNVKLLIYSTAQGLDPPPVSAHTLGNVVVDPPSPRV